VDEVSIAAMGAQGWDKPAVEVLQCLGQYSFSLRHCILHIRFKIQIGTRSQA
jgi:hypothetical protein